MTAAIMTIVASKQSSALGLNFERVKIKKPSDKTSVVIRIGILICVTL